MGRGLMGAVPPSFADPSHLSPELGLKHPSCLLRAGVALTPVSLSQATRCPGLQSFQLVSVPCHEPPPWGSSWSPA